MTYKFRLIALAAGAAFMALGSEYGSGLLMVAGLTCLLHVGLDASEAAFPRRSDRYLRHLEARRDALLAKRDLLAEQYRARQAIEAEAARLRARYWKLDALRQASPNEHERRPAAARMDEVADRHNALVGRRGN